MRAIDPDWWVTPQVQLLREIEHGIEVLQWQNTEGAHRNPPTGFPMRTPLTAAERKSERDARPKKPDALPLDDMARWLGWDKRADRQQTPKEA